MITRNVLHHVYTNAINHSIPQIILQTVLGFFSLWLLLDVDAIPSIILCALWIIGIGTVSYLQSGKSISSPLQVDWRSVLDHLYDAAVCGFSFVDIFCDVAVTIQFYMSGHMKFFWISMFILFLAQIAYAAMVAFSLDPLPHRDNAKMDYKQQANYRNQKNVILFIVALPFGQLVPLYLMAVNAFPGKFDRIHKKLGYKSILGGLERELFSAGGKRSSNDDDEDDLIHGDPLSLYIRHKLMSHMGFLIEALIEAIPQSILQMVFLIMYSDHVSTINLVSIFMSMIVVASKGTILSYSIYRSAAIFNFLCFSLDIFGIFCVVSWLFCTSPDIPSGHYNYEMYGYGMWKASYYYFCILQFVFKCFCCGMCGLILLITAEAYQRSANHPWREFYMVPLIAVAYSLLAFPALLVTLMVRFTLLPLLVLRVFDHSQNRSWAFYNKLFSFLTNSKSIGEMHEKLRVSQYVFSQIVDEESKERSKNGNNFPANYTYNVVWFSSEILKEYKQRNEEIPLSVMYGASGSPQLANYHRILEVLQLLFQRRGLWGFLFIKIVSFLRLTGLPSKWLFKFCVAIGVPLDMESLSFLWGKSENGVNSEWHQKQQEELEREFFETVDGIQSIIGWKEFTTQIRRMIQSIKENDYKAKWDRIVANLKNEWNALRNRYDHDFTGHFVRNLNKALYWLFVEGLYHCIARDLIHLVHVFKQKTASGLKARTEYSLRKSMWDYSDVMIWNIPKCWQSFGVMFGSSTNAKAMANPSAWDYKGNDYKYQSIEHWFGRGLFVFVVVVIFKCIHTPFRNLIKCSLSQFIGQCLAIVSAVLCIASLLILAMYSVVLPIIFVGHHVMEYGLDLSHNSLQMVLTAFYFVILSGIIGLFRRVWRFVYCDMHLIRFFGDNQSTPEKYADRAITTYHAADERNEIVLQVFGEDIGRLICEFLPRWHLLDKFVDY